jgi:DNA-binding NtrC family response regulator
MRKHLPLQDPTRLVTVREVLAPIHGDHLAILVADDDPMVGDLIALALREVGHEVVTVRDGRAALDALESGAYDLAILDVRLPEVGGFDVLRRLRATDVEIDVVLMSGFGSIADAVAAIKADAVDYLAKPFETAQLIELVGDVAQRRATLTAASHAAGTAHGLIGRSRVMRQVRDRLLAFADSEAPVLVLGASGTGKELAARLIHDQSSRRRAPFVAINCAAFPDTLVESELFGHVRGAFTGAVRDRKGRLAVAEGGTLFLDEVAELSAAAQAKLLRVLEEKSYCAVGSSTPATADIRLVSATNQDLKRAIGAGRFREDLYYRIKVLDVNMPTLAQRDGDLPLLVEHFLRRDCGDTAPPRITPRAWAALQHYTFPGNVRELEHAIRRAVTLARGQDIRIEHLPDDIRGVVPQSIQADDGGSGPVLLGIAVERFEREFIRHALRAAAGNRGRAAEILGISRKHLWQKMREYRITDAEITVTTEPS